MFVHAGVCSVQDCIAAAYVPEQRGLVGLWFASQHQASQPAQLSVLCQLGVDGLCNAYLLAWLYVRKAAEFRIEHRCVTNGWPKQLYQVHAS